MIRSFINDHVGYKRKQPWNANIFIAHPSENKRNRCQDFHAFFCHLVSETANEVNIDPGSAQRIVASVPPKPPSKAIMKECSAIRRNATNEDSREIIVSPVRETMSIPETTGTIYITHNTSAAEQPRTHVTPAKSNKNPLLYYSTRSFSMFDKNLYFTTEAIEKIHYAFSDRDMQLWSMQKDELEMLAILVIDNGEAREEVAKLLEPCIMNKVNRKALQKHEYCLVGQFVYKAFKATDDNKLSLLSFPQFSPYQIVKVPKFRLWQGRMI